jgi:hypothetical protein
LGVAVEMLRFRSGELLGAAEADRGDREGVTGAGGATEAVSTARALRRPDISRLWRRGGECNCGGVAARRRGGEGGTMRLMSMGACSERPVRSPYDSTGRGLTTGLVSASYSGKKTEWTEVCSSKYLGMSLAGGRAGPEEAIRDDKGNRGEASGL